MSSSRSISDLKRALPLSLLTFVLLASAMVLMAGAAQTALPALPANWPSSNFEIGYADGAGGAAGLRAGGPFKFRYQYLSGGANTGEGWATWNSNGGFATSYIQESTANGFTPVFTYYQILQSSPGGGDEDQGVRTNLQNTTTMRSYMNDLKLLFQRAGAFPTTPVVVHVEPDMWGYIEQVSNDNAATLPVKVAATGIAELAGLPDNAMGLAQGIKKLRDQYAPNVILGYHVSVWGTGTDIFLDDSNDAEVDSNATRAGNFYKSLNTEFDLIFGEFSDRDAGLYQYAWRDGGAHWWDAADYRRAVNFLGKVSAMAQKRLVIWQIPLGNTKMRALNNTNNHYQDNRVEWFFDDAAQRANLQAFTDIGAIAFLYGSGGSGATHASDYGSDGVTNPAAINGNTRTSINSDDDGGYFKEKVQQYYAAGALPLSSVSSGNTPTPIPTSSVTATPMATATPAPTGEYYSTAHSDPAAADVGQSVMITADVTNMSGGSTLVDLELYGPEGKVAQEWWDNEPFEAGETRSFSLEWAIPGDAVAGAYSIKVGIFSGGDDWATLYDWNDEAGSLTVGAVAEVPPTPTSTPIPTATMTPIPTATSPSGPVGTTVAGACPVGQFKATYYNTTTASGTVAATACETGLDRNWGNGSPMPAVRTNNFSANWTGQFQFAGGSYTFRARSDDGIRVYLDNVILIDAWWDQGAETTHQKVVNVTPGEHTVKVLYYDRSQEAEVHVDWVGAGSVPNTATPVATATGTPASTATATPVPTSTATPTRTPTNTATAIPNATATRTPTATTPPAATATATATSGSSSACGTGRYRAEYFNNTALSGNPVVATCESGLDKNWGFGSPASGVRTDNFSARFTGTINFAAGNYTFTSRSDDGLRLYVDGTLVIDAWYDQGASDAHTGSMNLSAGTHVVKVEFYERTQEAELHVSW